VTEVATAARRRPRFEITTRPLIYGGNRLRLLENGDEFFPRLLAAINASARSVHLETYIFAEDKIGLRVGDALAAAADRGVAVRVVVDGFGTGAYGETLKTRLELLGAQVVIFRRARWWSLERRLLRRMHRKLALIDDQLAFIGGINIIDDHHHPDPEPARLGPRYDYAVMCEGPIVAPVALAMKRQWWTLQLLQSGRRDGSMPGSTLDNMPAPFPAGARAALLLRDNLRNRRTIEAAYLQAVGAAHREVLIACAYFLPGRTFRKALIDCARRGVRVRLLVQGRIEYAIQHYAQEALYGQLLDAGIQIHEYETSYLHAKVAVVDETWATVGSSNIDPYSLLLAREANVSVFDAAFARTLRASLEQSIERHSRQVHPQGFAGRGLLRRALNWVADGIVRFGAVALAGGRDY
jgi:cardiolipin synthase A/B